MFQFTLDVRTKSTSKVDKNMYSYVSWQGQDHRSNKVLPKLLPDSCEAPAKHSPNIFLMCLRLDL